MADFGPSKFEQDIDGGVQNATTALFGNPQAAGRMAYMRARAGLEDQNAQDLAQTAASRQAVAALLARGGHLSPQDSANLIANNYMAGQQDGAAGTFLSYNANTGQPDADVARSFVGAGKAIGPTDAFSLPGQANIITGQNTQANNLQASGAAQAFAQAVMQQGHEDSRNAASNAQSGANNAATIAGDMARNNSSPEKQAEDRILQGKGTDADKALIAQLYPGSAGSAFTLTPQDTGQVYGEIEAQLGIPAVVKSTGLPPTGAATIDPSLEAQIAAKASDIFNAQPRDQKNLASAVQQAIKGTVTATPADPGSSFLGYKYGAKPAQFAPAGAPAAAPAQPAAMPQGALMAAPPGTPEGSTAYKNGQPAGIVRGGYVYPTPGGA